MLVTMNENIKSKGAAISENSPLPNGHNAEQGFWTYATIPEPSVAALSGLGLLMLKKSKA
jgi:hypothetical protein